MFTVYRVKQDGRSPLRGHGESFCLFLLTMPRGQGSSVGSAGGLLLPSSSYFPGGLQSSLHKHRGRRPVERNLTLPVPAVASPGLEGTSRSLGSGGGLRCLYYTWQKDCEARVSCQSKPSQIWLVLQNKSIQLAGHSDSRHLCEDVSSLRGQHTKKEQKVNRGRDRGQNTPTNKPGAARNCLVSP